MTLRPPPRITMPGSGPRGGVLAEALGACAGELATAGATLLGGRCAVVVAPPAASQPVLSAMSSHAEKVRVTRSPREVLLAFARGEARLGPAPKRARLE